MCGYAVEMLRGCYETAWKLFRGSPRLRKGYYYPAPASAPAYPGSHNLWSRRWVSDEGWEDAALGEAAVPITIIKPNPPRLLPLPVVVGSPDCIENGENPSLSYSTDNCERRGRLLPLACYSVRDFFEWQTDVLDCRFAYQCARILAEQYTNLDTAQGMIEFMLGAGTDVTTFSQIGETIPNCAVAVKGTNCFVFITGTTNAQQAALQTLYFTVGLRDQGGYSSSSFYVDAAEEIESHILAAGGGTATRMVLIGHSYGGAVCAVIAARLRINDPVRRVEMVTFGRPKPGDQRMADLLGTLRQAHWAAWDDPVPWLPPDGNGLLDLFGFLGAALFFQWVRYGRLSHTVQITEDIEFVASDENLLDQGTMTQIAIVIQAAAAPAPFFGHFISTYAQRLRGGCKSIDTDCDMFPVIYVPPPPPYNLYITSLGFNSTTGPRDITQGYELSYDAESRQYVGYNGDDLEIQVDTSDINYNAETVITVIFTPLLHDTVFHAFQWAFPYLDFIAGIYSTAAPELSYGDTDDTVTSFGSLSISPLPFPG